MTKTKRLSVSLPLSGAELHQHRNIVRRLVDAGYTEIWTGEVTDLDSITPLALFAGWEPAVRIASGVANVFTRSAPLLALQAAALAEAAPGRVTFGIGASSDVIVSKWNGIPFERPYTKVSETLEYLREVLRDGASTRAYETIPGSGFRLGRTPSVPPRLCVAALGPRMLSLAAARADTVFLNYLSAKDVTTTLQKFSGVERSIDAPLEIAVRVFVFPEVEPGEADIAARRAITGYLTVPVYERFQRWLGREAELEPMWAAWAAGDRAAAVREVPADVVDALMIRGTPAECAGGVASYLEYGADTVSIRLLPSGARPLSADDETGFLEDLARHLQSECPELAVSLTDSKG